MILKKLENRTEIETSGMLIRVCNKRKETSVFSKGLPQLQVEDEDGFGGYVNLTDEAIDALCEALQRAKQI